MCSGQRRRDRRQGSLIGTNLSGTAALANGGDGIFLEDAGASTIGGLAAGQGNLISGNAATASRSPARPAETWSREHDRHRSAGDPALPNGGFGVSIEGTTNTLVQSDLISGNALRRRADHRLRRRGQPHLRLDIGTDRAGDRARQRPGVLNNGIGVFVNGAAGNAIGGDGAGAGNLISGNATAGVYIFGRFASGNTVAGQPDRHRRGRQGPSC